MTNRERALQIADVAKKRAEAHDYMDTGDAMLYALVLALADISERLEDCAEQLNGIHILGAGVADNRGC